jgi:hypothetical protein
MDPIMTMTRVLRSLVNFTVPTHRVLICATEIGIPGLRLAEEVLGTDEAALPVRDSLVRAVRSGFAPPTRCPRPTPQTCCPAGESEHICVNLRACLRQVVDTARVLVAVLTSG